MDKYSNFCKKCIDGRVEYNPYFYELNPKNSETDRKSDKPVEVTLGSPTEVAVEQAESEIELKQGQKVFGSLSMRAQPSETLVMH